MSNLAVVPVVAGAPKRMSTPKRLRVYVAVIGGLAALLLFLGEGTLAGARHANKTVGRDAAPSILAAQEINADLADLDANVGNLLLGNATHQAAASATIEKRRVNLTHTLVDAASNITYGDEERGPITEIFDGLGRYLEQMTEARVRQERGDAPGALQTYRAATALVHDKLLPAAGRLDQANSRYLDAAYESERARGGVAEVFALFIGGLLFVALVHAQSFLRSRMRRRVNLPLLGATAITAGFTLYLVAAMGGARDHLRVAKEDAFDTIHWLWKARAIAYDANGDESRYLLDRERQKAHEGAFAAKVAQLTSRPGASVAEAQAAAKSKTDIGGLFGKELSNITFKGELESVVDFIGAFAGYYAIDQKIRAAEAGGRHDAAVELAIGTRPDESNAAFDRFDQGLGKTIALNRKHFDAEVEEADASLRVATWVNPLVSIFIALLAWLGIRPRLREYAA